MKRTSKGVSAAAIEKSGSKPVLTHPKMMHKRTRKGAGKSMRKA